MTVFGPDISSYQAGLNLSHLVDASFVIAKASEGTYYTDADYPGWRAQAAQLGKPFVWYHFLSGEDAAAQVAHTKACVGDAMLPGMLDIEPEGSFKPTLAQVLAYADAARAAKLNLRLAYLPHWFWQQIGSPSLAGLASRGIALVSSSYPGGTGSPIALYPGDGAGGWAAYGGLTPALYQYTNQATDGGQSLDYNAFRGSMAQLSALLYGSPTTIGDGDMTPDQANQLQQIYSALFGGGSSCGTPVPAGHRGTGYAYGPQNNNGVFSHLDYITELAEKTAGSPMVAMDPNVLVAQIVAKLPSETPLDAATIAALSSAIETTLEQHNLGGVSAAQMQAAFAAASAALKG